MADADSTRRTCTIEGCARTPQARGWCITHYARWRKHGDPLFGGEVKQDSRGLTPEERYEVFADKSGGPDACWPWTGPTDHQFGYGVIAIGGKARMGAHRWVLKRKLGRALGPDEETLHECDNPPCVNPNHLRVGTHIDNVYDMHSKGRFVAWQSLKTDCKRGHPLSGDNLKVDNTGKRNCRECARDRARDAARAKAAERRLTQVPKPDRTHCKHGHSLSAPNVYVDGSGRRHCRACSAVRQAEYQRRKRERGSA